MENSLIERIKNEDTTAFKELYNLYSSYALRTAYSITKNKEDASDAVQETFLKVYKNIHLFDTSKPFKAWFYRILINECNNVFRKKSSTVSMHNYLENDNELSEKDTYAYEEYETLYQALSQLKDVIRIPLILKYLNDLSEKEISSILNLNAGTVKSRLFTGRKKLKEIIEKLDRRGV